MLLFQTLRNAFAPPELAVKARERGNRMGMWYTRKWD